jgi:hypothetical protein
MVSNLHRFLQCNQLVEGVRPLGALFGQKRNQCGSRNAAVGSDFMGRNLALVQQFGEVRTRNPKQISSFLRGHDFGAGLKAIQ